MTNAYNKISAKNKSKYEIKKGYEYKSILT